MRLGQWAKLKGISYKTAWRMWRDGRLPVHAEQLRTGTVVIDLPDEQVGGEALYARVSSADLPVLIASWPRRRRSPPLQTSASPIRSRKSHPAPRHAARVTKAVHD